MPGHHPESKTKSTFRLLSAFSLSKRKTENEDEVNAEVEEVETVARVMSKQDNVTASQRKLSSMPI